MKSKHISNKLRLDIVKTVSFLSQHSHSSFEGILKKLSIHRSTYYRLKTNISARLNRKINLNKITKLEISKVVNFAKKEGNYYHRELAYQMIDRDIAFMSPSSVYRILKASGLILENKTKKTVREHFNPHETPTQPDEFWQSDITYIPFKKRMYYLLIFIDIYSRYITYHKLMTDMTSLTVSHSFEYVIKHKKLLQKPTLQTDNGSCYIGKEFKKLILDLNITHNRITPGCPNQNAEIERCNRTIKENLLDYSVPKTFQELEKTIEKVVDLYNHKRYHSSLNYLPPKIYYRGNPKIILDERKRKLQVAKKARITANKNAYNLTKDSSLKIGFCPTLV